MVAVFTVRMVVVVMGVVIVRVAMHVRRMVAMFTIMVMVGVIAQKVGVDV